MVRLCVSYGLCLWLLFCLFLTGCGAPSSPDVKEPEYRLTYNVFFPSSHAAARLAQSWAEEVYRRTDGRVRVDVYPGGVLSNDSENFNCVYFGATDLGMSCFAYNRGLFPLIECLDLPHGYRDGIQATRIANDFIRHFQPAELNGVELMYAHGHGPGVLASHDRITRCEDVKNMRLRGTGVTALAIGALGADAVGLSQGETYEALRKGVVQGTLCPIETLNGWRQGEVVNHVTKIPSLGYTTAMFVVMNKKTWASLPRDIQGTIREVNEEWIVKHGKTWVEMDAEGEALVHALGKTVDVVSPEEDRKFSAALAPVLASWSESAERKGLPGKAALAFIRDAIRQNGHPEGGE